ncbi:MAG TPA: hypothetical protein ENI97_14485 [Gammaproteobacteria bacterium]|nr:hypothetical protein [Gammaproteobacteria bacterium]
MKKQKNATDKVDLSKRKLGATALAVTAAGLFGGISKTGLTLLPEAEAGKKKFACWGINSCKATTDCTTAFNACNGKNDCKGKGFKYVSSAEACKEKGGVPLKGSPADPKKS